MKKVFKDGEHDISNDDYHASEGVSRSGLWLLHKAPAYYYHRYLNPYYVESRGNQNLIMGNLVHTLTLEPNLFDKEFVIKKELIPLPKKNLQRIIGKEAFAIQKIKIAEVEEANEILIEEFNSSSQGRQVITQNDYNQAVNIAASVMKEEIALSLLDTAKIEQSIYWTHEATGIQFKARPDAWLGSIVIDLKTTADGSLKSFQKSAYTYGYFLQAGMISEALRSIGIEMEKFIILSVEKKEPYATANFIMDDEAVRYGIDLFDKLAQELKQCKDSGRWPAYPLQVLSLPKYADLKELY